MSSSEGWSLGYWGVGLGVPAGSCPCRSAGLQVITESHWARLESQVSGAADLGDRNHLQERTSCAAQLRVES